MEAQVAEEKVEQAEIEVGWRRLWAKARAKVADSAWGSLAGKGVLYVAGFALLAAVGSGRIHCLAAPAHEHERAKEAASVAAPPPPASAIASAPAPPEAPGSRPDAGAELDAGGDAATDADGGAGGGMRADGKVALNAATEEDLRHLPGIGATRAKAILALRGKLGRFSRVEDLLRVKGIGRRSLARLRPLVLLD